MQLPRLVTRRLVLRPFTRDDEAIHQLVWADPEVAGPFSGGGTLTLEQVREWLVHRFLQAAEDDLGFWAVVRAADDALLGLVALQPYVPWWIVWEHDPSTRHRRVEVELSYALGRPYWGNGYATEAGRALVAYAFETLGLAHRLRRGRREHALRRRDAAAGVPPGAQPAPGRGRGRGRRARQRPGLSGPARTPVKYPRCAP